MGAEDCMEMIGLGLEIGYISGKSALEGILRDGKGRDEAG